MEPLSIRLAGFEVRSILVITARAHQICNDEAKPDKSQIRNQTIILAEFHSTWWKRTAALLYKKPGAKDPLYKIPVSVARVIHYRLQQLPLTHENQMLLQKLDQILLNRNLRPPFSTEIL